MGTWIRVATAKDIEPGQARRVDIDGQMIAVFNVGGRFYAVDDTCSHAEASLSDGKVDGQTVACPLHGARFDLATGRALSLPAVRRVGTYKVRVAGSDLLVEFED